MKRFWVIEFMFFDQSENKIPLFYCDYGGLFSLVPDVKMAKPFITKTGADATLAQLRQEKIEMSYLPKPLVRHNGFE